MTPRELADLCERAPGFDAETLKEIADTLRSQEDEINRLAEGIILCIDASWRPNEARDWGRPELILSDYVGELHAKIDALKGDRTTVRTVDGNRMNPRKLAHKIDALHSILCAMQPGILTPIAASLMLILPKVVSSLREQYLMQDSLESQGVAHAIQVKELIAEIDALKAAAIVAGSIKLDEAVKVATRREAIKAAWVRITGHCGWLSCVAEHDCRCLRARTINTDARSTDDPECTCRADDFRKLMDE